MGEARDVVDGLDGDAGMRRRTIPSLDVLRAARSCPRCRSRLRRASARSRSALLQCGASTRASPSAFCPSCGRDLGRAATAAAADALRPRPRTGTPWERPRAHRLRRRRSSRRRSRCSPRPTRFFRAHAGRPGGIGAPLLYGRHRRLRRARGRARSTTRSSARIVGSAFDGLRRPAPSSSAHAHVVQGGVGLVVQPDPRADLHRGRAVHRGRDRPPAAPAAARRSAGGLRGHLPRGLLRARPRSLLSIVPVCGGCSWRGLLRSCSRSSASSEAHGDLRGQGGGRACCCPWSCCCCCCALGLRSSAGSVGLAGRHEPCQPAMAVAARWRSAFAARRGAAAPGRDLRRHRRSWARRGRRCSHLDRLPVTVCVFKAVTGLPVPDLRRARARWAASFDLRPRRRARDEPAGHRRRRWPSCPGRWPTSCCCRAAARSRARRWAAPRGRRRCAAVVVAAVAANWAYLVAAGR